MKGGFVFDADIAADNVVSDSYSPSVLRFLIVWVSHSTPTHRTTHCYRLVCHFNYLLHGMQRDELCIYVIDIPDSSMIPFLYLCVEEHKLLHFKDVRMLFFFVFFLAGL